MQIVRRGYLLYFDYTILKIPLNFQFTSRSAPSGSLYDTIMSHFNNQHEDALKYVPAELLDSR